MMESKVGYLVLESGDIFSGVWRGGAPQAGEVVFNTSHSGYEEMSTDPSYFSQILVTTAPMQGNYGEADNVWESNKMWINGFICLEIQQSEGDSSWLNKLVHQGIPVLTDVDTRSLVLHLRDQGTTWGALVFAENEVEAKELAFSLINKEKNKERDWVYQVTTSEAFDIQGDKLDGPKIAVLDFGCKKNIIRELVKRSRILRIFPSRTSAEQIRQWAPDGIMLTNGPGDPKNVQDGVETVKELLGEKFIFGICMGHQILSLALGANTYKLKFGHRGGNHPVKDELSNEIYMTSQNHGYAVEKESLPKGAIVTHTNLNDNTVSGIHFPERKCLSLQFHPESCPGPHDAGSLFDFFIKQIQ